MNDYFRMAIRKDHYESMTTNRAESKASLCKSIVVLWILCFLVVPQPASQAHEGPPFPIIIDEVIGPWLVSVWTDPDIGIGTFFVVFEPDPNAGDQSDSISSVQIGVEPLSGRLGEVLYEAETQRVRTGARYWAEVEFDQGEMWRVRILIEGDGWDRELISEVEATPDGSIGPIAILIYALPFLAIGFIWIRAILVRRRAD